MNPPNPTPVREWLEIRLKGRLYGERAQRACLRPTARVSTIHEAIRVMWPWYTTKEDIDRWRAVHEHYCCGTTQLPSLPQDDYPPVTTLDPDTVSPGPVTTTNTTTHMNYGTTPVAKPTLVYGEDVADMSEARCMEVIRALSGQIKDLSGLDVESATITRRIAERKSAIDAVLARLDSFTA